MAAPAACGDGGKCPPAANCAACDFKREEKAKLMAQLWAIDPSAHAHALAAMKL
eukprot:gene4897-1766_t